ncbi:MAG: leucine-rich repeat protein [Lachnospiraceae bacterium]|nr:leucine-rich repeat protein [Lachnospiraceae bacterium]
MKIQELSTEYGILQYRVIEDHIMITEYRGKDIVLTIPVNIDGIPVTVIGKKAFLAARELKEVTLPQSVCVIQDWAFASCRNLEKLALPRKKLEIGQGILKDCEKLCRVITITVEKKERNEPVEDVKNETGIETDKSDENISYLLAAAMTRLDAFYLFDTDAAGSSSWIEQWDARMIALIEQEDTEGFSKMLLCGEEDYGSRENNIDYYIEQKRRFKVRLAMLRLMNDIELNSPVRNILLTYLKSHTKGCDSEETWKVVLEEHGDEKPYYQLLLDTDCITEDNIDAILEDMGERHTEMKAFLMSYQSTNFRNEDMFASLEFEL